MLPILLAVQTPHSILHAAEVQQGDVRNYQFYCMQKVLNLSIIHQSVDKPDSIPMPDLWKWPGVKYENGLLTHIHWGKEVYYRYCIFEWLPSTVRYFYLKIKVRNTELSTRSLPRELEECTISTTRLRGHLELQTLPARLRVLDLSGNYFFGTIALIDLPRSMQRIDLSCNRINIALIDASALPGSLQKCTLNEQIKVHWLTAEEDSRVVVDSFLERTFARYIR